LTYPLFSIATHGDARHPGNQLIVGNRLPVLRSLRTRLSSTVKLAYADIPRLQGYDDTRAFQAEEAGHTWGTWLTVLRDHLADLKPLLATTGVVVVHAGDLEEAYAKLILFELFGHENYLGTIVWGTHYSAKGGRGAEDISTIHECLICFATNREALGRIAFLERAEGYANPDDDPRGRWEARQKDAGRDTAKVRYNVPPYRWRLVGDKKLPPGLWRVSPMSGVIWGNPERAGKYKFTVEVSDAEGRSSTADFEIDVKRGDDQPTIETSVWWQTEPPAESKRAPRLIGTPLPQARVGQEYCAVLKATGGTPFRGTPRPSRGWGFGEQTLLRAILEDRCYFGLKGTSIPEPKRYEPPDNLKAVNASTWWDGAQYGRTQDATKHMRALLEAGLVQSLVPNCKPEILLSRVVDLFTRQGDCVLELFGRGGDMAAVAMKRGRRFVSLAGGSADELAYVKQSAIPRLTAVIDGKESAALETAARAAESKNETPAERAPAPEQAGKRASKPETKKPICLPYSRGGHFHVLELRPAVAINCATEDTPRLLLEEYKDEDDLCRALLSAEGFFEAKAEKWIRGVSYDGSIEACILSPRVFLDSLLAGELASSASNGRRFVVYYFRCTEDFDRAEGLTSTIFKRLPMDLVAR
jgi:hypothetical protein